MSENAKAGTDGLDSTGFSSILVVLDMLAIQLEDIAKDVEASVTGVCSGFQGMSTRARAALSTAADALDNSADGGGLQAFIHRVSMALEVMLQRIESSRDFSAHLSGEIEEISVRLGVINELEGQLSRICEITKQATASGREGLRSGADCRAALSTLVEKTSVLASVVTASSQSISSITTGLSVSIRKVSARVKNKAEEEQDATKSSELTVRSTLEKLSCSYDKMMKSLSNSAAMSRQLNLDIGQAVMSMQFQDRVNQRIQHLIETIVELRKELIPFTKAADKDKVKSISEYWMERVAEKSTMKAERVGVNATDESSDENSIELF
jgi:methyl-accepting chemotaxis protein